MQEEVQKSDRQTRPMLKHKITETSEARQLECHASPTSALGTGTGHLHFAEYFSGDILHSSHAFGGWRVGEGMSPNTSGLCGEEEIPVHTRKAAHSQSLH